MLCLCEQVVWTLSVIKTQPNSLSIMQKLRVTDPLISGSKDQSNPNCLLGVGDLTYSNRVSLKDARFHVYHRTTATYKSQNEQDAAAILKIPGSAENSQQTKACGLTRGRASGTHRSCSLAAG